jgi:hypothetical protein
MQPMTLQEVFDNALFGIRQQGYKRSIASGGCAYDSNAGHCGIGHSFAKAGINGGLIDRAMRDTSILVLLERPRFEDEATEEDVRAADAELYKVAELFAGLDPVALATLQSIHDDELGDDPREHARYFEAAMASFAKENDLTYTPA